MAPQNLSSDHTPIPDLSDVPALSLRFLDLATVRRIIEASMKDGELPLDVARKISRIQAAGMDPSIRYCLTNLYDPVVDEGLCLSTSGDERLRAINRFVRRHQVSACWLLNDLLLITDPPPPEAEEEQSK